MGLETCMTLGMLNATQSRRLAEAGLDYYNHNLDTFPEYYEEIVTTRRYADRLQTLENVRSAGIKVCSGGIVGMGESSRDRMGLLLQLANMPEHPESVPVNQLVKTEGTPLAEVDEIDWTEVVKTIAVARIMMPAAFVRLSAGREHMSEEMQAQCFLAGANSIFYGECLLTISNPQIRQDKTLLAKPGINSPENAVLLTLKRQIRNKKLNTRYFIMQPPFRYSQSVYLQRCSLWYRSLWLVKL